MSGPAGSTVDADDKVPAGMPARPRKAWRALLFLLFFFGFFDLGYAYTFDPNELKRPMIEIVRHAGWNFRPVIIFFRPFGG